MAADITEEEIIQICNNFLLSSPPGEFMEVVTDVRGLLYDDSLINDTAPAIFREYNTDQMLSVKNGDHQVLITKYGEISDSEYLDPTSKQIVGFDHIRQELTGNNKSAGGAMDSSIENYRSAFDQAAAQYCQEHFLNGTTTTYGAKVSGQTNITICLSSAKFNPNNFWNGRWRSVWTCVVNGSKASLSGNIKINVHYYEDGNVQLNTETTKTASVNGSDPASLAKAALQQIKKIESDFHASLEHSYQTMSETTFKALRRVLPITRCKIDWNKIKNYRIGNDAASSR